MKLTAFEARAIAWLVPQAFREEFVGDLLEECSHHWREEHSREAHRWIRGQILASIPSMLRYRFERGGKRARLRWGVSALGLTMGALQAWDSGLFGSSPSVITLVTAALLSLAFATLFATSHFVLFGVAAVALAATGIARVLSPVPLPELGLSCLPGILTAWFSFKWSISRTTTPTSPGPA